MNLAAWRTTSPLLTDLDDESFAFLEDISEEVQYPPDRVIFRVNTPADRFFMVAEGTVALRMAGPTRPAVTIQTVRSGGVLGLSWQMPPHLWQWTAQSIDATTLAMFDAESVRQRFLNLTRTRARTHAGPGLRGPQATPERPTPTARCIWR